MLSVTPVLPRGEFGACRPRTSPSAHRQHQAPGDGRVEYWDEATPGFGFACTAAGRKTWVVLYRHTAPTRRLTLGTYPTLPLADAREADQGRATGRRQGQRPRGGEEGRPPRRHLRRVGRGLHRAVRQAEQAVMEGRPPRARPRSPARLQNRKADDLKRRDIKKLLAEIKARGAPVLANRTLEIVRRIYNWGIDEERVEHNPCLGIEPSAEQSRDRVLSEDEIRAVWVALDTSPQRPRHVSACCC